MPANSTPQQWGDPQTTTSYALKLEGSVFGQFLDLSSGYGLDTLNYDLSEAVKITTYSIERGRLKPRRTTIQPAQVLEVNADLLIPQGRVAWSAIQEVAGKRCPRNLFACFLCPTQPAYAHFIRFPETLMDEVQRTSKLLEQSDNPAPLTAKTTLHFTREMTYYALRAVIVGGDPEPIYDGAFLLAQCDNCAEGEHEIGVFAGAEISKDTSNGFTSGVDDGLVITTGMIIESIFAEGLLRIYVGTDGTDPIIKVSRDGGISYTDTTPAGVAGATFHTIVRANGWFYVAGNAGAVYRSQDGSTWTLLGNTGLTTAVFRAAAFDPDKDLVYIVGDSAPSTPHGVVLYYAGATAVDITTQVNSGFSAAPAGWHSVAVLGDDHVVIGGTTGSFAEGLKVTSGATFLDGKVGDPTGIIRAVAGDEWRTVLANDDVLYQRDVCGDLLWSELPVTGGTGLSDNFSFIRLGDTERGINQMIAGTLGGETVRIVPMTPDGL